MNSIIELITFAAMLLAIAALIAVFIRKASPATNLTLVWWLLVLCGAVRCLRFVSFVWNSFSSVPLAFQSSTSSALLKNIVGDLLVGPIEVLVLFYLATRIAAVRTRYTSTPPLRTLFELRATASSAETKAAVTEGLRAAEARSRDAAASLKSQFGAIRHTAEAAWANTAGLTGTLRAKTVASDFWSRLSVQQRKTLIVVSVLMFAITIAISTRTSDRSSATKNVSGNLVAEISCTGVNGGTVPLQACMSNGGGIELRNGDSYKSYMRHDVEQMGRLTGHVVEIDLAQEFKIIAIHGGESYAVLNVAIRNTDSGTVTFQRSAKPNGSINVSN